MGIQEDLARHLKASGVSTNDTALNDPFSEQKAFTAQLSAEVGKGPLGNTKEGGTLWRVLDFLQRGQYASVGAARAVLTNQPVAPAAWAGLKGETKGSWVQIAEELIPGRHPWTERSIGFAADVVFDPINLVPVGWAGKTARLLKLPQALGRLGDVAVVDSLMRKVKPGWALRKVNLLRATDDVAVSVRGIKGVVSKGDVVPDYADPLQLDQLLRAGKIEKTNAYDLWRDLQLELSYIRRNVQGEMAERWGEFSKIAKKLGKDPGEEAANLIRLRELGAEDLVRSEYEHLYDEVVDGLNAMRDREVAAGILRKPLENYFPHIFEMTEKGGFFTKLGFRATPFFAKARTFRTIDEAKQTLANWKKRGYAKDWAPVENFFRGYAIRQYVSDSVFAWRKFIDQTLGSYGMRAEELLEESAMKMMGKPIGKMTPDELQRWLVQSRLDIPRGMSVVMEVPNLRAPAMVGMESKAIKQAMQEIQVTSLGERMFSRMQKAVVEVPLGEALKWGGNKKLWLLPSELAHEVKKTFKVFTSEDETRGLLRAYDQVLHGWKSMATSLRVPFHMRNALSNLWLMYIGGVKARKLLPRVTEATQMQVGSGKFFGRHPAMMMDLANRYGVRGYGWVAADIPTMFHKELRAIEKAPRTYKAGGGVPWLSFPGQGKLARTGRRAGTYIEDNARIALWLNRMEELGATSKTPLVEFQRIAKEASSHVKRYLFDYTELTPFERNVMKRVIPFYTWMRKNIPLQVQSVVEQPWKYTRLAKFHQDIGPLALGDQVETPSQKFFKPEYMREMKYTPTGWTDTKGNRVYFHVDLPTEDLTKMFQLRNWVSSLTPAKVLYDIASNVMNFPTTQEIQKFPGQRVPAPFYVSWLGGTKGGEKLLKFMDVGPTRYARTGETVVGMSPLWRYGLENAFPFLNEWSRRFPQPGTMTIEDQGKWKTLSYFTGIKFKPLDIESQAIRKYFKTVEARKTLPKISRSRGGKLSPEEQRQALEELLR